MQWTGGGFVPATGAVPDAGVTKGGFVQGGEIFVPEVQAAIVRHRNRQAAVVTGPRNVVAMAKARLREVKSELRRMKALEKERGELERLIAAAESKPAKSNLREIKRSAG
jgi:hypothetical protein